MFQIQLLFKNRISKLYQDLQTYYKKLLVALYTL